MILFVGLGNPGKQYADTRHNFGFLAVDALASKLGADGWKQKFNGEWCKARLGSEDVYLLKPQTFMNLSGTSVQPAAGRSRPRTSSCCTTSSIFRSASCASNREAGMLATTVCELYPEARHAEFARIRLGIGRPPGDYPGGVVNGRSRVSKVSIARRYPTCVRRPCWRVNRLAVSGFARRRTDSTRLRRSVRRNRRHRSRLLRSHLARPNLLRPEPRTRV